MFTGIVEAACPLLVAREHEGGRRLVIDLGPLRALAADPIADPIADLDPGVKGAGEAPEPGLPGPQGPLVGLGDSVAVNGVCLTVAALDGDEAAFDVVPESLSRTNLGRTLPQSSVNVERAMRFGARVDGHLVQGHVESCAPLSARESLPGELRLTVGCGPDFISRCLPKGSVTVNGVSLTVAELHSDAFVVALVPHTLERTTLGDLALGDFVNLEPDMIGQWVLRAVANMHGGTGGPS